MLGISSNGKNGIAKIVEDIFDKISLQFVGNLPHLKHKKLLLFNTKPIHGLPHLFVQAMNNKTPNAIESEVLKSMLNTAHGYIETVKRRTTNSLTERLEEIVKEAKVAGEKVNESKIREVVSDEFKKARSALLTTVEAESTKARNIGHAMDISRVAAAHGNSDPNVFFAMVRDGSTCSECIKLHMMPDGITPRVWKLSELKQGYHKRGENMPSAFGLHPHCRCTLVYLTEGFGFDSTGKIEFVALGHDAHSHQRKPKK